MDKYEQLAQAFEIEELEERIEFFQCDFTTIYNQCKDWVASAKDAVGDGPDGCSTIAPS